jgi:uncharacterized membrane protein
MPGRVCYLGDDDLPLAAVYLAGIMTRFGLAYDYVPSTRGPADALRGGPHDLYVLSDYPAARFRPGDLEMVAERVRAGAGLAMFGGWESYHGRLGEYHRSPLADVLPVLMAQRDDRRNCAQPCLVKPVAEHPITAGLPWDQPPTIGGFNAFRPKPDAATLLASVQFCVRREGDDFQFTRGEESPLLVVGQFGRGRVAALATDVAPHWVGGMVDWGDQRVVQEMPFGFIDVGSWYAQFFRNLLVWTGRFEKKE